MANDERVECASSGKLVSPDDPRITTCRFCDGGCALKASSGHVEPLNPAMPAICSKAVRYQEIIGHKKRLTTPLKNVGTRKAPQWEAISWDEALDQIAIRLKKIIYAYGPEAVAFADMPLNHGFGGITRRFMNHLGSPNYTTPLNLCMGNTAQVHRATYGWFTTSVWDTTDCIVYFGQNRGPELWPAEYLKLKAALDRGATLIVIDPRKTPTAELADYHLPIAYGTDAALALAWIHVIIRDELYDKEFVDTQTYGFDDLAERVEQYSPQWAASICGIPAELIEETARVYAAASAAIIPWGATTDMQVNSTSALRCMCILRALCGFINVSELVYGPAEPSYVSNSELANFAALTPEQKAKQLGATEYPLLSFRTEPLYEAALERISITWPQDIVATSYIANPSALFAAMRGEGPYPVKAFFAVATNTLMNFANQQGIKEALLNQDLVVAFEVNMTPTAQMADFVLPGDMWPERDSFGIPFDTAPVLTSARAFETAPADVRDWYFVMRELALRLDMAHVFPWKEAHELYDWRVAGLGTTWAAECDTPAKPLQPLAFGQFLTPTGKVELKSTVLEALGCDPLPYYVDIHAGADEAHAAGYPYEIFAGAREEANYNTNLHQIDFLRERAPEPELYINPVDAHNESLADGQWTRVSTVHGAIKLRTCIDEAQPAGTLRIPHGWWKPELDPGAETGYSGANHHNDGMLFDDGPDMLDAEQGLANLRGGVYAKVEAL